MSGTESTAKRARLSPEERRKQLIGVGHEMLRERPLGDITVAAVTAQAGVSRALLFHYFPTLEDYHRAILHNANAELLDHVRPNPALAPLDMLRDSMERFIGYVEHNQTAYHAMLRGPASASPVVVEQAEDTRGKIAEMLFAVVPIDAADPDRPRLELAVRGWIAYLEQVVLTWLAEPTITREQLIDLFVRSLPALTLTPQIAAILATDLPEISPPATE
ncbi:TetR/AcrR family transcriptional regulator [Nocardia stercoris]|uniref:TetR/AcrR family transcriptional regulator n=1 Tax=Nocardia stercoris TaxID=2483361 RepID=UPI0038994BE5